MGRAVRMAPDASQGWRTGGRGEEAGGSCAYTLIEFQARRFHERSASPCQQPRSKPSHFSTSRPHPPLSHYPAHNNPSLPQPSPAPPLPFCTTPAPPIPPPPPPHHHPPPRPPPPQRPTYLLPRVPPRCKLPGPSHPAHRHLPPLPRDLVDLDDLPHPLARAQRLLPRLHRRVVAVRGLGVLGGLYGGDVGRVGGGGGGNGWSGCFECWPQGLLGCDGKEG